MSRQQTSHSLIWPEVHPLIGRHQRRPPPAHMGDYHLQEEAE